MALHAVAHAGFQKFGESRDSRRRDEHVEGFR